VTVSFGAIGCSGSAAGAPPGDAGLSEEADSFGDRDPVDGGEEDPDGVDDDEDAHDEGWGSPADVPSADLSPCSYLESRG
jgi:hypothetical protein